MEKKTKEDVIRELVWLGFRQAQNAYRLYPENKHTFSDHSEHLMIEGIKIFAQFKDERCDAMGHYGGEKPEGICPKCGKPWKDEKQKEEEWPKDQPDIPDNKVFINGEWKSPESGEQDEELWTEVIGNVVAAESLDDNESIQEFNSRVVEILKSKFHITKK